ncbi:MAG: NusG domain II-containing protein [Oscillospiraceae bacterium]|nr:NusG domain II-containing protein [Oscillospiraceae bacterium]
MKSNKFWLILLCSILLLSALSALLIFESDRSLAHIYHDGIRIDTLDLNEISEMLTLTLTFENGTNTIEAERGRIRMATADCPDRTCVHQGWISRGSLPIVCLPHRLVIRLDDNHKLDLDAVTR